MKLGRKNKIIFFSKNKYEKSFLSTYTMMSRTISLTILHQQLTIFEQSKKLTSEIRKLQNPIENSVKRLKSAKTKIAIISKTRPVQKKPSTPSDSAQKSAQDRMVVGFVGDKIFFM